MSAFARIAMAVLISAIATGGTGSERQRVFRSGSQGLDEADMPRDIRDKSNDGYTLTNRNVRS